MSRTNNNRVIMACELYCCLLPQCEALRICRSGFPIAITPSLPHSNTYLCSARFIVNITHQHDKDITLQAIYCCACYLVGLLIITSRIWNRAKSDMRLASRRLVTPALCYRPVVLKLVDIDPQGLIGPSKRSINSHGVEWGSVNGQGVNE